MHQLALLGMRQCEGRSTLAPVRNGAPPCLKPREFERESDDDVATDVAVKGRDGGESNHESARCVAMDQPGDNAPVAPVVSCHGHEEPMEASGITAVGGCLAPCPSYYASAALAWSDGFYD